MKKDKYPDVRIEIISEGLAKKILGKPETATPSVYGEEKPTGENLPNVDSKSRNKELQSLLETSNKKPDYTGLVKESIQELRKDNQNKYAVGSDKPENTAPGPQTGPDFGAQRKRKNTPTIYRGTGFRGRETDAPLMDEDRPQDFMRRRGTPIAPQASTSERGLSSDVVDREDQALLYGEGFSRGTTREGTTIQGGKVGDIQPALTEAGFGRGASEEAKQSIPMRAVMDRSKKESARMRGPSSIGSGRLEEAMIKEAIQELRKAPPESQYGKFQPGGRTGAIAESIGDTSRTSRDIQSAPRTQTVERGVRLNPPPEDKPGSMGLAGDVAVFGDKYGPVNVRGTTTGTPDLVAPGMPGAGGVPRLEGMKTGYTNVSEEDMTAADKQTRASGLAADKFDYGSISSMGTPTRAATSGEKFDREQANKNKVGTADAASLVGGPDFNEDVIEDRSSGTLPPEPDKIEPVEAPLLDVDDAAAAVANDVTGINPNEAGGDEPPKELDSEFDLGVRADPNKTRPNNPTDPSKILPAFGSSGYFDAVLNIGEGNTKLNSTNYGVGNLEDFLELYPQNPTFSQSNLKEKYGDDSLANLFGTTQKADFEKAEVENPFKASLKKAPMVGGAAGQMPKSTTMNRPANMGVGMQQPVVTGAGTMKNTEKAVAANKPRAAGASKKTRATKRKAGSIADLAKQALIKKGMVWDVRIRDWVSIK